jgi:hypothetical protein
MTVNLLCRNVPDRVTILEEFSPFGKLFTFGSILENNRSGTHFRATVFRGTIDVFTYFVEKWLVLNFGIFFSRTQPATLLPDKGWVLTNKLN